MKTWFEVWALGETDDMWDIEEYLGEFATKEAAIEHAKKFKDISYIYDSDVLESLSDEAAMRVQVETVKETDFGAENIDTVYEAEIFMPEVK